MATAAGQSSRQLHLDLVGYRRTMKAELHKRYISRWPFLYAFFLKDGEGGASNENTESEEILS